MPDVITRRIEWTGPLGRHVEHDPRSRNYPAATVGVATVWWPHHYSVLNQGNTGSCTGNAATQCLATGDVYRKPFRPSEATARKVYSIATTLDSIPGSFPPDDTGSTGLAVAKACKQLGYIGSYTHAFGLGHARGAIGVAPFIVGTDWYESMFNPDPDGTVHPVGEIAGGHEYLCLGYEETTDRFAFLNSWGRKWGVPIPEAHVTGGGFFMAAADLGKLLADQGDIVSFVV